jgi:hypothetical protein
MSYKVSRQLKSVASMALIAAADAILTLAICQPAFTQTQYEWVPGSRQARVVPSGQSGQGGQGRQAPQQRYQQQTQQYQQQQYQRQQYQRQYQQVPNQSSAANQSSSAATTQSQQSQQKGKSYHFVDSVMVDGLQRQFQVLDFPLLN